MSNDSVVYAVGTGRIDMDKMWDHLVATVQKGSAENEVARVSRR